MKTKDEPTHDDVLIALRRVIIEGCPDAASPDDLNAIASVTMAYAEIVKHRPPPTVLEHKP